MWNPFSTASRLEQLELAELNRQDSESPDVVNIKGGYVKMTTVIPNYGPFAGVPEVTFEVRSKDSLAPTLTFQEYEIDALRAVVKMCDESMNHDGEKS